MTYVDLDDVHADRRQVSVLARLVAVLDDGREMVLLDDRGWSCTLHSCGSAERGDIWALTSIAEIEETARTVVGPDEPVDGESFDEMATAHWSALADVLARHGVTADPHLLPRLAHEVVISEPLRSRFTT